MSEPYRELQKHESDALGLPRRVAEEEIVWFSRADGQVFYGNSERVPPELRAPMPVDKE